MFGLSGVELIDFAPIHLLIKRNQGIVRERTLVEADLSYSCCTRRFLSCFLNQHFEVNSYWMDFSTDRKVVFFLPKNS